MKAISLTRPWPYTILHLEKRIENRSRKDGRMPNICRHRGPLLLHAAKSWDDGVYEWMVERELAAMTRPHGWNRNGGEHHPAGAIVGRCRAIGHINPVGPGIAVNFDRSGSARMSPCRRGMAILDYDKERAARGDGHPDYEVIRSLDWRWWMGGYALILADVEPTRVVECRGALGCWTVPDDVLTKLEIAA